MPKAAIISKPQKPELCEILKQLLEWFAGHGYECVLDPESAGYLNRRQDAVERPDMPSYNPEVCVTLGGDGTLLSAARAFAYTETPILGCNLGSLGFLTEVPLSDLFATLEAWKSGTAFIDMRHMMHAELVRDNQSPREWLALNDVVLAKGAIARMGVFGIELDAVPVHTTRDVDGMNRSRRCLY